VVIRTSNRSVTLQPTNPPGPTGQPRNTTAASCTGEGEINVKMCGHPGGGGTFWHRSQRRGEPCLTLRVLKGNCYPYMVNHTISTFLIRTVLHTQCSITFTLNKLLPNANKLPPASAITMYFYSFQRSAIKHNYF
jgi:hypothetical protein